MLDRILPLSNASELKKRVIVGAVGAAALVLLILFGGWVGICVLATGLSLAMIYEYSLMTFTMKDQVEKRYALLFLTWFVGVGNLIFSHAEFELLITGFIGLFGFYLFAAEHHSDSDYLTHFRELVASLFGAVYLIFLPLYLTRIHSLTDGVRWTVLFFLIVWSADSAAYFAGKYYGKRKLYSRISPKKTVEGAAGGLLAAIVITMVFKLLFLSSMSWLSALLIPIVVGIFSQIGDLCESFLKRALGKKDSGSILPGHGGFLDRFDAVVFSLPVMYACIRIFGG